MYVTTYDRDVLREVIDGEPNSEQVLTWLTEVLKIADRKKSAHFKLPFPKYVTNNHSEPKPESVIKDTPPSKKEESESESASDVDRHIAKAMKWAERQEFEFSFRRDVHARDRSICRFGSHRIEEGEEIAKIGVSGSRGDVLNLWGCVPCFEAIVEEYGLEVDD